jgi:hypothetical protein
VKRELQRHYDRVLKQNPVNPFKDQQSEQQARAGDIDFGYPNPLFLVIISKDELDDSGPKQAAICLNQVELTRFIKKQAVGTTWTMFDLLNSVHALSSALAKSQPRKRGRANH